MKKEIGCGLVLLRFLVTVPIGVISTLMGGYVLSKFWLWFLVSPLAVSAITYKQAIGVMMVASFFTMGLTRQVAELKDNEDDVDTVVTKGMWQSIAFLVLAYPLTLGVGWCWHWFIG